MDRPPTGHVVPLVATGVRKRFGAAVALAGVDLDVRTGTIVGIVGPNGSGKTTLLNGVAGLVALDAGTIEVVGSPAGSRLARAASALVPDDPAGLDELTVEEHIALVHALWRPGAEAAGRAEVLLSAFGLEPRRRQRLGTLSRGLRRQASVVAACSLAPPLLLVDEATATLDPEAVVVLGEALATLAAGGCGVLLATQDLHFAGAVCDELLLLDKGVVADRGEPGVLCARHEAATLEEAFLAAVGEIGLRERVRSELAAL